MKHNTPPAENGGLGKVDRNFMHLRFGTRLFYSLPRVKLPAAGGSCGAVAVKHCFAPYAPVVHHALGGWEVGGGWRDNISLRSTEITPAFCYCCFLSDIFNMAV